MWIGWKAKFLTSHAAGLRPDRANAILDKFIAEHGHAFEEGKVQGNDLVQHPGDGEGGLSTETGGSS